MVRAIVTLILLVLGAMALARGLYLQGELTRQLDTGAMGAIRSWIMWSTRDGRELVTWYRMVTPWLLWGGGATLGLGLVVALWPARGGETGSADSSKDHVVRAPRAPRKPRGKRRSDT